MHKNVSRVPEIKKTFPVLFWQQRSCERCRPTKPTDADKQADRQSDRKRNRQMLPVTVQGKYFYLLSFPADMHAQSVLVTVTRSYQSHAMTGS